jgi:hypothetical protein
MIVTSRLSIDIVRYLHRRTQGTSHQWTTLGEVADHIYGPQDVLFGQAVDLARCRGWIIVEGKSASRRACLTKAGCSLVPSAGLHSSASCQPPTVCQERTGKRQEHGSAPAHRKQKTAAGLL